MTPRGRVARVACMLKPAPAAALRLAAEVPCDPRTATKAMAEGSRAIRGLRGFTVARVMARLGIDDPAPAVDTAPHRGAR